MTKSFSDNCDFWVSNLVNNNDKNSEIKDNNNLT